MQESRKTALFDAVEKTFSCLGPGEFEQNVRSIDKGQGRIQEFLKEGGRGWYQSATNLPGSQSIKIGIDLSIEKSIKIGKSDLIDIDCIDQSIEIYDTLVSFIDSSRFHRFHRFISENASVLLFIQKWKNWFHANSEFIDNWVAIEDRKIKQLSLRAVASTRQDEAVASSWFWPFFFFWRNFSSLRRLKIWSRTSMANARLNGLALAYINRPTEIDTSSVLKRWDASGLSRIAFAFSKE